MSNIYFSKWDDDRWATKSEHMTYFFVPRKWWSIEQWKLAIGFRRNFDLHGFVPKREER